MVRIMTRWLLASLALVSATAFAATGADLSADYTEAGDLVHQAASRLVQSAMNPIPAVLFFSNPLDDLASQLTAAGLKNAPPDSRWPHPDRCRPHTFPDLPGWHCENSLREEILAETNAALKDIVKQTGDLSLAYRGKDGMRGSSYRIEIFNSHTTKHWARVQSSELLDDLIVDPPSILPDGCLYYQLLVDFPDGRIIYRATACKDAKGYQIKPD